MTPHDGRRSDGFRLQVVLWLCGLVYIIAMIAFFLGGKGILAAHLTIPGWLAVAGAMLALMSLSPTLEAFAVSDAGNLLALGLSALLNVAGASFLLWLGRLAAHGKAPQKK